MKTLVISGGTDGMGNALAHTYLSRGDAVIIIGRNAHKGRAFLDAAHATGAADQASFLHADLSRIGENERVIAEIRNRFPVVDALVLCARHFGSTRSATADGFEHTFALEYLSRYLLSHGLVATMQRAAEPVIVNLSGPGVPKPDLHWDDLQLTRGYDGVTAQLQAGRANDLLGIAFAARHGAKPVRYVLINPGAVATSFSGEYDAATAAHVEALKRHGKPVRDGIAPIVARIDQPPAETLSAFIESRQIDTPHNDTDTAAAARLDDLTRTLLIGRLP